MSLVVASTQFSLQLFEGAQHKLGRTLTSYGKNSARLLKRACSVNFFPVLTTMPTLNRRLRSNITEDKYLNQTSNLNKNKNQINLYKVYSAAKKPI